MLKYIMGFFILSFWACTPDASKQANAVAGDHYFFDLKGFFNTEIKKLNADKVKADKTVRYNTQKEVQQNQDLDYAKELAVFVHSDINKPAWREKYQADTLREAGAIRSIRYQALDEQLKTQKVTIQFSEEKVQSIQILNHLKSIIANNWQELKYIPGEGYQVSGKQNMRLAGQDEMGVAVRFVR
jgi:hypothetical protein